MQFMHQSQVVSRLRRATSRASRSLRSRSAGRGSRINRGTTTAWEFAAHTKPISIYEI